MSNDSVDVASALNFAVELAREAGKITNRYFQAKDMGQTWKEDDSPVTIADTSINKLVIQKIKDRYPEHGVIGEEESYEEKRDWVWVVDPIDGTSPFILGIPMSTFCLALVHNGEVLLSVVYDPFQDRMITAQKGKGTYNGDIKLSVSNSSTFNKQYVLAFRSLTKPNHSGINQMFDTIQKEGAKIYMFASFSYAGLLVAEGHMTMACMVYGSPWDAAAISLIVQEAGGTVTDLHGKPRKYYEWGDGLLISNGQVHQRTLDLIDYENTRD